MMKRVLAAASLGVLVSSLGAVAACSSPSSDDENAKSATAALESANVAIDLFDANGSKVGEGAGVLIAPNLVLTSGHLIAGKAKWTITTADGKKTVNGTRGLTYDWMEYNSLKSHPRKHDVGVIYLDKPIQLAAYPQLASTKSATGSSAMRVRHLKGAFELVDAKLSNIRTFPHAYATEMSNSETVNTGGAVIDAKGSIVGVVTGRGMTTSKLYIARTDGLAAWLAPKVVCAGGKAGTSLGVRTYGAPPPKPGCDAGTGTSSGGTSGTSGGTSGTSGGTSGTSGGSSGSSSGSSGSSSGSSGSSGGGGTCDDGGGECSGDCSGGGGGGSSSGSSGSSGSDGTTSGGTSGTSGGTSGTSGSSGSDGTTSGGTSGTSGGTSGTSGGTSGTSGTSGSDGTTSGGTSGGTSGTSGTSGGTSGSSGSSGSDNLPPGSSSGSSGGTGDQEVCEGPSDNPDECPPEAAGCSGAECGGGAPDSTIDYGNCACSSPVGSGSLPVIR